MDTAYCRQVDRVKSSPPQRRKNVMLMSSLRIPPSNINWTRWKQTKFQPLGSTDQVSWAMPSHLYVAKRFAWLSWLIRKTQLQWVSTPPTSSEASSNCWAILVPREARATTDLRFTSIPRRTCSKTTLEAAEVGLTLSRWPKAAT